MPRKSLHVKKVVRAYKKFEKGPFDWDQSSAENMQAKAQRKVENRKAQEEAVLVRRADPFFWAAHPEKMKFNTGFQAALTLAGLRATTGDLSPRYEACADAYAKKWLLALPDTEKHRRLCFANLCYSDKLYEEMVFEMDAMGFEDLEHAVFGKYLHIALCRLIGWGMLINA